jgi:two-component system chemotaxis response regulator CheY
MLVNEPRNGFVRCGDGNPMKTLIVEDDAVSRLLLVELLSGYGPVTAVENGESALQTVQASLKLKLPFDLICLDIMLPGKDGQQILSEIRGAELDAGYLLGRGAKILMTTQKRDKDSIFSSFRELCDGYLPKPFAKSALQDQLRSLALIP